MTANRTSVEFYVGRDLLVTVATSMVPPAGSYVNIRGKTYRVVLVTYAIDHSDDRDKRGIRANVDLTPNL